MYEDKILYYPKIIIPGDWIKWAVLYWDKVGSIVPEDCRLEEFKGEIDEELIVNMQFLKNEKVLDYLNPQELFRKHSGVFTADFISLYKQNRTKKIVNEPVQLIYLSKMTYEIIEFLKENNEIVHKLDYNKILVYDSVANIFMGLLARYLADYDNDNVTPNTNDHSFHDLVYAKKTNEKLDTMNVALSEILPVPTIDNSIDDIIQFKINHYDEFIKLRERVNKFQHEINNAQTISEVNILISDLRLEINESCQSIKAKLKSRRMSFTMASLRTTLFAGKIALDPSDIALEVGSYLFDMIQCLPITDKKGKKTYSYIMEARENSIVNY